MSGSAPEFSAAAREVVYRVIHRRRDVRHFLPQPLAPELLERLLQAAHAAPSVGLSQPWHFIRITDAALRAGIHALVMEERSRTAQALDARADEFLRLKVEGIRECAELLVVTEHVRGDEIFGRRTMPHMALASVACAIQNLWLAARAEGVGMGWVSMFDPATLADLLALPAAHRPVAILCLGYTPEFLEEPLLQSVGWRHGCELHEMLTENGV